MPLATRLFRESALERLSSPEQLDQQLQVTSPRGWAALTAIWALLAAVIAWLLLGSVPTKEAGQGILVAGGGLRVVVSPGTGRLSRIDVNVGDEIEADQVVALIDQQEIVDKLNETRSQLAELQRQHDLLLEHERREEELQERLAVVDEARLEQTIRFSQERLERLTEQHAIVADLVNDGMMTEIDLHKIEESMAEARLAIDKASLEIQQLVARNNTATVERERQRMEREFRIAELQGKAEMLDGRLQRESEIVSRFAGRVVEVRAAEQSTIATGEPILLIEPPHTELEAILYVSAETGKRIREGMEAQVSPSTVKREEHGSMVGVVAFVADVPTSKSAMLADLGDLDLVEKLAEQIGLPLELRVDLLRSEETVSRYAWTSSGGPPGRVSAGTLCSGLVTVKKQRPIELLVPLVKKKLGLE